MSQEKTIIPELLKKKIENNENATEKCNDKTQMLTPKTQVGKNAGQEPAPAPAPAAAPAAAAAPAPAPAAGNIDAGGPTVLQDTPKAAPQTPKNVIQLQDRPIVGMLFTISNGGKAEIFPLYMGRNVVGRTAAADVCLNEESISLEQAIILVRKYDKNKIHFTIVDNGSSNGTLINGELIEELETHLLEDGSILDFGSGYKMKFFKLLGEELGLKPNPCFKAAKFIQPVQQNNGEERTRLYFGNAGSNPRPAPAPHPAPAPQPAAHQTPQPIQFPQTPLDDNDEPRTVLYTK